MENDWTFRLRKKAKILCALLKVFFSVGDWVQFLGEGRIVGLGEGSQRCLDEHV